MELKARAWSRRGIVIPRLRGRGEREVLPRHGEYSYMLYSQYLVQLLKQKWEARPFERINTKIVGGRAMGRQWALEGCAN